MTGENDRLLVEIEKEIAWADNRLRKMADDRSYLGNAPIKIKAYLAGLKKARAIIENKDAEEIGWILNP